MFTELSGVLNHAGVLVRPEDLLAKKGSWFTFSGAWPSDQVFGWAANKSFVVSQDPILTPIYQSYILQNNDYQYVDLSNQFPTSSTGQPASLQLYPARTQVLYQIAISMSPGKYFVQTQLPKGVYIYTPGSSVLFPNISDPVLRYVGAKYAPSSPDAGAIWMAYAIQQMPAIILIPFVDGVDFEKCTFKFFVNKCVLSPQTLTPDQIKQSTLIEYYTELSGF